LFAANGISTTTSLHRSFYCGTMSAATRSTTAPGSDLMTGLTATASSFTGSSQAGAAARQVQEPAAVFEARISCHYRRSHWLHPLTNKYTAASPQVSRISFPSGQVTMNPFSILMPCHFSLLCTIPLSPCLAALAMPAAEL
jgi:hypothetical protein